MARVFITGSAAGLGKLSSGVAHRVANQDRLLAICERLGIIALPE